MDAVHVAVDEASIVARRAAEEGFVAVDEAVAEAVDASKKPLLDQKDLSHKVRARLRT